MKENSKTPVLLERVSNEQRFETLVRLYSSSLYRYAFWLCQDKGIAEDLVQETFLRAWRSLDSLKKDKAAKSWLITIVRRENARRFEKKRPDTVDMPLDTFATEHANEPETKQKGTELQRDIMRLAPEYREPLVLSLLYGFTADEIGKIMELNANTVMTRIHRAKKQLQEQLKAHQ